MIFTDFPGVDSRRTQGYQGRLPGRKRRQIGRGLHDKTKKTEVVSRSLLILKGHKHRAKAAFTGKW